MNALDQKFDLHFSTGDSYTSPNITPSFINKNFHNISFFLSTLWGPVICLGFSALLNKCDDVTWAYNSARVGRNFEAIGCRFSINGLNHLKNMTEPCIFVGNHMSTLETFLLPTIIRPHMPVTFVVKKSLYDLPLFGSILKSRDAIVVARKSPRQDLQNMLDEGKKRLDKGMSVVIFPQSTRSTTFNPAKFNSIGVKLAKYANRPIIPLALKTDTWAQGKFIKDFGVVHREKTIHFTFGAPIHVEGHGKVEHNNICNFIKEHVQLWINDETI